MGLRGFASENGIRLLGFPQLDEVDDETARKALEKGHARLLRHFFGFELVLQAKRFSASGSRKQHEVHARLMAPGVVLASTATGWNFLSALQESLGGLEKEAVKKTSLGK